MAETRDDIITVANKQTLEDGCRLELLRRVLCDQHHDDGRSKDP